jgi:hypothetical protein
LNSVNVPVGSGDSCECKTAIGNTDGFPIYIKFVSFLPVGWTFLPGHDTVFYDTGELTIKIIASENGEFGDTGSVVAVGYNSSGKEVGSMICQMVIGQRVFCGDANHDGVVDIGDIVYLINYVFYNGPAPIDPSDANNDGVVDIGDLVYLINYVFYSGPEPTCG